jgi:diguanylate cyclase (GGDEF)-like protein
MLLNILLVDNDDQDRQWLQSTLQAGGLQPNITAINKLTVKTEHFLTNDIQVLIVTESQCAGAIKKMEKCFSLQEAPLAVLVLTDGFGTFNVSKYQQLTMDSFSKYSLTPQLLSHLVLALVRDFEKDSRLRILAHFDDMTGATNRHLFNDRLKQTLVRAKRYKEPLALLYLDLDKFKQVNDLYGHEVGDALLIRFVTMLKKIVRESDTIGRLGGDEFAILLPKADAAYAKVLATNILDTLAKPKTVRNIKLSIATSIGIASVDGRENQAELSVKSITRKADIAVYQAKNNGRNQYVLYDPTQTNIPNETD